MTQAERVLVFIRSHPGCSTMELQYGLQPFVANPRARISDLRAAGHNVVCYRRKDGANGYYVSLVPVQQALAL